MPTTPDGIKFNLDDFLIKMASQDQMRLQSLDYVKKMLSTIDHTPDHPVYPVMIQDAIMDLDEDGGSTKDAISEFIMRKYDVLPVVHPAKLIQQLDKLVKEEQVVLTSEVRYMLPVENAPHAKLKKGKMHLKKHGKSQRINKLSKGDERIRISEAHNLNMEVDNELQIEETDRPPGFTNAIHLQDGQIKDFVEEKHKVTEKKKVFDGKQRLQGLTQTFNGHLNYDMNGRKASVIEGFEIANLSLQEPMGLSENQGLGITAERFFQVNGGHLDLVEDEGFCVVRPASRVDNETPAEVIQGRREEIEALEEQSQQQGNALKDFKDRMELESSLKVTEEILQIEQHPECEERNGSTQPQIQQSFYDEEHSQPEQVHVSAMEAAEEQGQLQEQASVIEAGFCAVKLAKVIDDQRHAEEVPEGQEHIEAIGEQSQQQGNAIGSLKVQVEVEQEVLRIKHPESEELKGQTQSQVKQSYCDEGYSQFEKMHLRDIVETGEQRRLQEQASMEMNDQYEAHCQIQGTDDLCYVEHSENEINEYVAQDHVLQNLHVDKHPQLEQMHRVENEATEEQRKLQQQTFKIIHGYVEAECQVQVTEELYQLEHHEDKKIGDENLHEVKCNSHFEEHLQSEQLQGTEEAENYRILDKQAVKVTDAEREASCKASEEPHGVDCLGNGEIIGEAQPCVQHGAVEHSQADELQSKMTSNQGERQQPNFEVSEEKKSQHEQKNYLRNKINGHSNMADILANEPQQYEDMSLTSSPCTSHNLDCAMPSLSLLSFKDKLLDLLERTRGIEQELREMISCLPATEVSTHINQNPMVRAVPKVPESERQILSCPVYVQADPMQHDQNQEIELPSLQTSPDVEKMALKENFQEQRQHTVSEASLVRQGPVVHQGAQGLDLTVKQDIVRDKAKILKSEFVKEKQLEKSVPEVSNDSDQNPKMEEIPMVSESECQIRMCFVYAQVDPMQHEQNQEIELPNHQRSPDVEILALKEWSQKQREHVEAETSLVPQNAQGFDIRVKKLSQVQLQQDIDHGKAKILESKKPRDHVEPEASLVPLNAQGMELKVKQLSQVLLQQDILNGRAKIPEAELEEEQQLETSVDKAATEDKMISAQQPCQIEQEMQEQQLQLQDQRPSNSESGNHAAAYDSLPNSEMLQEPKKTVMVDRSFQPLKQPEMKCLPGEQIQGKPQQRQLRSRCPMPSEPHSYHAVGANSGSLQLSSSGSQRKHKLEPPNHKRPRKQRPRDGEESVQQEQEVNHQKQVGLQQELGSNMGETHASKVQDQPLCNNTAELLPPEHGKERKDQPLNRPRGRPPRPKPDVHIAGREEQPFQHVKHDENPPAKRGRGRPPKNSTGLHQPKRQKKHPQDRSSR